MAGSCTKEAQEEHGVVSVFFLCVCVSMGPHVCQCCIEQKRWGEGVVQGGGGGGGGSVPGDRCGLCPAALGTKEACCYYACWRFLRGDKLGPGR